MTETLKELCEKVTAANNPKQSAEMLINGVADQLDNLTHDPVAIGAMAKELRENATEFGAAILTEHTHTRHRGGSK